MFGDIGELFGAITYGIKLHRNYAQGSDGRLGNDFVEKKTIAPFNNNDRVTVRLNRHFNRLLVVKIDRDFNVSGRLVDRKSLPMPKNNVVQIGWGSLREPANALVEKNR